jgi:hypothetical protein
VIHPRRPGDPRAGAVLARHARVFGPKGPPTPVESIAEDLLGLRVAEADLRVSGLLVPAAREVWLSAAEAAQSPARRRFTLAHEIGHWVCQVREGRGEPIHCRPEPGAPATEPREREANVFAAELLMPEDAVRRAVAGGAAPADLEALFGVSPPAMAWRLYNLGIVDRPPPASG